MAGLVPAIHVLVARKTWMPGTKPGMTTIADILSAIFTTRSDSDRNGPYNRGDRPEL